MNQGKKYDTSSCQQPLQQLILQQPFKPIKNRRQVLTELPCHQYQYNQCITDENSDAWQHSPGAQFNNSIQKELISKQNHLSLYNKFSATITSFQRAYMKQNNRNHKLQSQCKERCRKGKLLSKRSSSTLRQQSMHGNIRNEFILSKDASITNSTNFKKKNVSLNKENQQEVINNSIAANCSDPLIISSTNNLKTNPNQYFSIGSKMNHKKTIKKVQINFLEQNIEAIKNHERNINKAFEPTALSLKLKNSNCLGSQGYSNKQRQRALMTAKYVRRKVSSISKIKCTGKATENIQDRIEKTEATKSIRNFPQKNTQNLKRSSSRSSSTLNGLIFQFLNKEEKKNNCLESNNVKSRGIFQLQTKSILQNTFSNKRIGKNKRLI